jgi:hypothetical protein
MSTGLQRLRMAIVKLNKLQCMPENMSQLLSNKTHMPKNLYQMSSENTDAAFAVELESPKGGGVALE